MLPVASGIGGGSADAAAALRLLARAYDVDLDDPRVLSAARRTASDVPVCIDPRPRLMYGAGELLSAPLRLPSLAAVLVNPGAPLATKEVFAAFDRNQIDSMPIVANEGVIPRKRDELMEFLRARANALESVAISLEPAIAYVLRELRATRGCLLARMSGAGATCYGLYDSIAAAEAASRALGSRNSTWWVHATMLGTG
jgi:4-diphosphocytidyl-2-C-methyl-D-erythritol kinase